MEIVIPSLDGGGTQVFRGESDHDLVVALSKAQAHATAKIRKQARELKQSDALLQAGVNLILELLRTTRQSRNITAEKVIEQIVKRAKQE